MNAPARRRPRLLRLGIVALLLAAAFLTSLPWVGCAFNPISHAFDLFLLRVCTFGLGFPLGPRPGLPGFDGPYWGNLVLGVAYAASALFVALTKRSF